MLQNDEIIKIVDKWGIQCNKIIKIQSNVWFIAGTYVLKQYDSLEPLLCTIETMLELSGNYFRVPRILRLCNKDAFFYVYDNLFYIMMERWNYTKITSKELSSQLVFTLGDELANLHLAMRSLANYSISMRKNFLITTAPYCRLQLPNLNLKSITPQEIDGIFSELEMWYQILPQQYIHGDVHFDNFLFNGLDYIGCIDFDNARKDLRVFDLCYASFMIFRLLESPFRKKRFKELSDIFFNAYNKIVPLVDEEWRAMPILSKAVGLSLATYFQYEEIFPDFNKALLFYQIYSS